MDIKKLEYEVNKRLIGSNLWVTKVMRCPGGFSFYYKTKEKDKMIFIDDLDVDKNDAAGSIQGYILLEEA